MSDLTHNVDKGALGAQTKFLLPGQLGFRNFRNNAPGKGTPQPCAKFSGHQSSPMVLTASFQTSGPQINGILTPGPFVAVVMFGSGNGAMQTVEVDLPCNFSGGNNFCAGGVQVSVPCANVELWARNDAALLALVGDQTIGQAPNPQTSEVVATGSVGVGVRTGSGFPVRTVYAVLGSGAGQGLANGATVQIPVPPFSKAVRVARFDMANNSLSIVLAGLSAAEGPYVVPANVAAPKLEFGGDLQTVNVTNAGPNEILSMVALFDIDV